MRILIVGAGATGGAFGARLVDAGRDVAFLVRPARAEALRRDGLRLRAPDGDATRPARAITAAELHREPAGFDLVIVTVKAAGLDAAIEDVRPAVGPGTVVLPVLNGMAHLGPLEEAFPGRVLGGLAHIVASLEDDGAVTQLTDLSVVTVPAGHPALAEALDVPGIDLVVSPDITGAMWEKWAFIAAMGVVCCLFRAPIGAVLEAGGEAHVRAVIAETEAVAAAAGHPVSAASHERTVAVLTATGSPVTSSLYRDLVAGRPTEAEPVLGDLAARARGLGVAVPLLDLTLTQVRADALQRATR